jgi:hypothetical protein
MIPEPPESIPVVVRPPLAIHQPALPNVPDTGQVPGAPTQEERQALEAVFAQPERQPAPGAGLLGAWAAAMMLNDVVVDHLTPPAEEEREEKDKKKKSPEPPD